MPDKTNVSCNSRIQILSFMIPTLFAHILGDSIYKIHAKRVWAIRKKNVFLPYKKLLCNQAYAKNVRIPKFDERFYASN